MNDSRKRIALVCSPLAFNGGTFRHLLSWCRNLDHKKFRIALFCNFLNSDHEKSASESLAKIHEIEFHSINFLFPKKNLLNGGFFQFTKLLKRFQPDLIHSVLIQADLICSVARLFCGFPMHISSWEGSLALKAFHGNLIRYIYRSLLIPAQLGIKRFISLSKATAQQNCLDFGLNPKKVQVVHLGLDLLKFPFKFCENSRKIGIISRLSKEKQVDLFVRAIPKIHKAFPEYRFLIAGDGTEKSNLEQLARDLKIDDIIDFVGWQNKVETILWNLEIFVFTSSDEGLGWAMLEAMASGCPVVASCVGGIPEVIDNNENGMLVRSATPEEFAEKIVYLISNPDQKRKMAIKAREKIESRFSDNSETTALEKIYCEILGG